MKTDYLIVGSGYAGSILAERIASQLDKKVLIVEKRNHIGGNAYDYYDDQGILVHKYGPHIFHTNAKKVWDYLSNFTDWLPYYHHVLAVVEGKTVPVPFNFNSIEKLFPIKYAESLSKKLIEKYGFGQKIPILKLKNTRDKDLKFLANYIYENVFLGYTTKQWGYKPEEIDKSVTSRVPVFLSRDDRYFQDKWQGIPANGYTEMFKKMIDHPNINILLKTDYKNIENELKYKKLIFTGMIDQYFDFGFGRLPYRSLEFDLRNFRIEKFQETAQVNYPNNHDYTRITEFKHFSGQKADSTTVAYEYPTEFISGQNDPYYPIPKKENHEVFKKYDKEAAKLKGKVYFVGRLAEYKYYNMDQIAAAALSLFEKEISGKK